MRRSISKTDNIFYLLSKFSATSVLAVMMMMTIMSALAASGTFPDPWPCFRAPPRDGGDIQRPKIIVMVMIMPKVLAKEDDQDKKRIMSFMAMNAVAVRLVICRIPEIGQLNAFQGFIKMLGLFSGKGENLYYQHNHRHHE